MFATSAKTENHSLIQPRELQWQGKMMSTGQKKGARTGMSPVCAVTKPRSSLNFRAKDS